MQPLPTELWAKVFEHVSHIPGALDISDPKAIEAYSEDESGILLHYLYYETLKTKLSIGWVCSSWRRIIIPNLFEYIIIRSAQQAHIVARLLQRLRSTQDDETFYGQWVKRIEILMEYTYWDEGAVDSLAIILDHCPGLVVFSDFFSTGRIPNNTSEPILERLKSMCEHGHLRRIESSGAIAFPLQDLLCGTPSLKVLIANHLSIYNVSLPHLHTLVLGPSSTIFAFELACIEGPNLRHLITRSKVLDPSISYAHTNIKTLFPKLQHIRFQNAWEKEAFFKKDLDAISTITLDFGPWLAQSHFDDLEVSYPSATRLNLTRFPLASVRYPQNIIVENEFLRRFCTALLDATKNPALRTIGFHIPKSYFDTNSQTYTMPRTPRLGYELWEELVEKSEKRGIKLEASVGQEEHFQGLWRPFDVRFLPKRVPS